MQMYILVIFTYTYILAQYQTNHTYTSNLTMSESSAHSHPTCFIPHPQTDKIHSVQDKYALFNPHEQTSTIKSLPKPLQRPQGLGEVNGLRKDLTRSEIRCTIISFYDMINAQKKTIPCTCENDPLEYFGQEPNNSLVYSVLMKQAPGCSASVTTTASIYNESFMLGMCLSVIYKWLKCQLEGKCERIIIKRKQTSPEALLMSELWHSCQLISFSSFLAIYGNSGFSDSVFPIKCHTFCQSNQLILK